MRCRWAGREKGWAAHEGQRGTHTHTLQVTPAPGFAAQPQASIALSENRQEALQPGVRGSGGQSFSEDWSLAFAKDTEVTETRPSP